MINVGNISFRFRMADEVFAQQLYAGWDEFCRACFTDILKEYFGRYDMKDSYIEIDTLELNIGSIPQESFYEEFPKRVRAELERIVLSASVNAVSSSVSKGKRQENLIHYLRYGFCLPGWDMQEFDLFEELMFFKSTRTIFTLCFTEQYSFKRLTRQLDGWQLNIVLTHWLAVEQADDEQKRVLQHWTMRNPDAMRMLTGLVSENRMLSERIVTLIDSSEGFGEWHLMLSWLTSTALGHYEKQQYFAVVLETRPQMVLRFIRETSDEGNVKHLALLLESGSVRRIMVAETQSHAEVDVPDYWHHLYLWLIKHYPFNGVAMFGDKRNFVRHLHERFLFFIRKRSASTYLSKTDLTIRFLLEVFGADYYLEVLNILYHNQPLNDDGSPVNTDYYSREIYYMLLKLSLIKVAGSNVASGISAGRTDIAYETITASDLLRLLDSSTICLTDEIQAVLIRKSIEEDGAVLDKILEQIGSFDRWLTGSVLEASKKKILLHRLIKEQPLWVLRWIKSVSDKKVWSLLIDLISIEDVFALVATVSYQDSLSLSAVLHLLPDVKASVKWMRSIGNTRLEKVYIQSVITWLATGSTIIQGIELVKSIWGKIYSAVINGDETFVWSTAELDERTAVAVSEVISVLAEKSVITVSEEETSTLAIESADDVKVVITHLRSILGNTALSVAAKRKVLLRWIDTYRDNEIILFKAIFEAKLLPSVIEFLDISVLRLIVARMAATVTVGGSSSAFALFVEWIALNINSVVSTIFVSVEVVWERIIVQLITRKNNQHTSVDATISLIYAVCNRTGSDAFMQIIRLYETSATNISFEEVLTLLLVRVKEHLIHCDRIDADDRALKAVRMAFEHCLNEREKLITWLKSSEYSISLKQEVLKQFAINEPQVFMSLLQMSLNEDTLAIWSSVVDVKVVVSVIAKIDRLLADNILLTVSTIQRYASEWKISLGRYSSVEDSLINALLRFLLEHLARGNRLPERDVFVKTFTSYWREVITGRKEVADTNIDVWNRIETRIFSELKVAVADTVDNPSKPDETSSISSETEARGDELSSERLKKMSRAEIVRIPEARFLMLNEADFDVLAIWLASSEISDTVKARLLQRYTRWQQKVFWNFIGYVYAKSSFDVLLLNAWLGIEDWLMLVAGVSYSWAETLRQVVETLLKRASISNAVLSAAFALFVAQRRKDDWYRYDALAVVKDYMTSIKGVAEKLGCETDVVVIDTVFAEVVADLKVSDEEATELEETAQPEYIPVTNAGLCLFAPWLLRLFGMLDLLAEGRKDLKDIDARIRAIFILQRLVTAEELEYKESDLAFNRLLVACPFNVPLPKYLKLTDKEIETVESMLAGVKANWSKMANTSIGGFQRSFIEREGHLEQQESKWILTVENKAYDILLDSLPWSYKMIRLPWLKKPISVSWRDKEEFDFDSINR